MTIFQAECFLAVAEHLNFAKAAEQMHISNLPSHARSRRWREN